MTKLKTLLGAVTLTASTTAFAGILPVDHANTIGYTVCGSALTSLQSMLIGEQPHSTETVYNKKNPNVGAMSQTSNIIYTDGDVLVNSIVVRTGDTCHLEYTRTYYENTNCKDYARANGTSFKIFGNGYKVKTTNEFLTIYLIDGPNSSCIINRKEIIANAIAG